MILIWQFIVFSKSFPCLPQGFNYNPGQNISSKIEKSSKIEQDKKSLKSTFASFLTAIAKFNFWKGD